MEKERQQVENDAEWFRAEPWRFCPGEIVFILDADKKAKIGRVDCVRLNYCPDREQGKNPDADTRWVSEFNQSFETLYPNKQALIKYILADICVWR